MDSTTAATSDALLELDRSGITQPEDFDRDAAKARVREILPSLALIAGTELRLIDDLEDGCSFAEVSVREPAAVGQVAGAKIAVTFSNFGALALIWSSEFPTSDQSPICRQLAQALSSFGFQPVFSNDLSDGYAGIHDAWRGHSWRDRFFGES